MLSPEHSSKPNFIEIADGIRVAANIKVEKYLRFREGQQLYDQPPFSWLLVETDIVPEDIFKSEADQELIMKYLIYAAAQERGVKITLTDTDFLARLSPRLTEGQKKKKIEIRDRTYRQNFQKWFEPILAAGVDLHDSAVLYRLGRSVQAVIEYLQEYPDVFEYLHQLLVSKTEKAFSPDGAPLPEALRGEYRLKTYAGFAAYRRTLQNDWSKWVGLEALLPDDTAALAREADRGDDGLAYIIARSFLGNPNK